MGCYSHWVSYIANTYYGSFYDFQYNVSFYYSLTSALPQGHLLTFPFIYYFHFSFLNRIYQNPVILRAATKAFWTSCQVISKLLWFVNAAWRNNVRRVMVYPLPCKKKCLDSNRVIWRFFEFGPWCHAIWLDKNADVAHWLCK